MKPDVQTFPVQKHLDSLVVKKPAKLDFQLTMQEKLKVDSLYSLSVGRVLSSVFVLKA